MANNEKEKIAPLIGFTGPACSGKDTACDYLTQTYHFRKYSFAAPIKRALMAMFGLSIQHVDGDLKECNLDWLGKSPRQLMQTLGTEWGRNEVCSDLWVKVLAHETINDMALAEEFEEVWVGVISDIRFPEEAVWIRENGGIIVHISRSYIKSVSPHTSENGIAIHTNDAVISNNGTIQELKKTLDQFVIGLSGLNSNVDKLRLNPYA